MGRMKLPPNANPASLRDRLRESIGRNPGVWTLFYGFLRVNLFIVFPIWLGFWRFNREFKTRHPGMTLPNLPGVAISDVFFSRSMLGFYLIAIGIFQGWFGLRLLSRKNLARDTPFVTPWDRQKATLHLFGAVSFI